MNTRKGKAKFKNFRILLDSVCSSAILMGRLVEKLGPKIYYVIQYHTQAGNITTNLKVEVDFTLPELSAKTLFTCRYHVDDSTKGRYYMILGRDILIELGLNLKLSDHVI